MGKYHPLPVLVMENALCQAIGVFHKPSIPAGTLPCSLYTTVYNSAQTSPASATFFSTVLPGKRLTARLVTQLVRLLCVCVRVFGGRMGSCSKSKCYGKIEKKYNKPAIMSAGLASLLRHSSNVLISILMAALNEIIRFIVKIVYYFLAENCFY